MDDYASRKRSRGDEGVKEGGCAWYQSSAASEAPCPSEESWPTQFYSIDSGSGSASEPAISEGGGQPEPIDFSSGDETRARDRIEGTTRGGGVGMDDACEADEDEADGGEGGEGDEGGEGGEGDEGVDGLDGDEGGDGGDGDSQEKKFRFVWTASMHKRFEAAVLKLGVAHAKPQAIRQLMGCEGEEAAPTRQNIKSHLQKYRLLMQKQAAIAHAHHPPRLPEGARTQSPFIQMNHSSSSKSAAVLGQLQVGLLSQLELQAKLQHTMMTQRHTQASLAHMINASSTRALNGRQLQRLAQHVLVQRQMLQHLYSLLRACSIEMNESTPNIEPVHHSGPPAVMRSDGASSSQASSSMHLEVGQVPLQATALAEGGSAQQQQHHYHQHYQQ